jgi:hypothetical protein
LASFVTVLASMYRDAAGRRLAPATQGSGAAAAV